MDLKIDLLQKKYVDNVAMIETNLISHISSEDVEKTISSNTLDYFVLLKDNEVIGFLELSIIKPELEIIEIGIDNKFQGFGYSKVLMDFCLSYAKDNGCHTVFLEVNNINYKAISLYEKYGFEKYGERKKYYGVNDAILMKRKI